MWFELSEVSSSYNKKAFKEQQRFCGGGEIMKGLFFIGSVRRSLMVKGSHKWNGWVRDVTAKLEGSWLIRSEER